MDTLKCEITGNVCGTDTWIDGHPCKCKNCQAWLQMTKHKIDILDNSIDHIRKRPGMYISDISDAQTIFKELIDNAVDEVLNNYGNRINLETIKLPSKNYGYLVQDNCGGIPTYPVYNYNNQVVTKLLITKSFSSGKFDNERYKYSAGTHGLGLTIVNALSSKLIICSHDKNNKRIYRIQTKEGKVVDERWINYKVDPKSSPVNFTQYNLGKGLVGDGGSIDTVENISLTLPEVPWWSTSAYSEPDETIFETTKAKIVSKNSLELISSLLGTNVSLNGNQVSKFDPKSDLEKEVLTDQYYFVDETVGSVKVMIAFSWSKGDYDEVIRGAVNTTPCHLGLHVKEARYALGKAIEKVDESITANDCRYGLRMFVSAFVSQPIFIGQTKYKLSEAKDWDKKEVSECLIKAFDKILEENEEFKSALIKRLLACKEQFSQLSDIQYVNSIIKKGNDKRVKYGVGSEVYECTSPKREETELFIVEGKGAAGNLNKKRNRKIQAILPLRGKLLNVLKLEGDVRTIFANNEIVAMVKTIGIGVAPDEDLSQCRYGKIFICTDADSDGAQIEALVLGAFTYLTPILFSVGKIYIVETPLYKQGGKFIWDEKDLIKGKKCDRYKGLGSMDADELYEAVLDPKTRRIKQVTLDDKAYVIDIMSKSREKRDIMIKNKIIVEDL